MIVRPCASCGQVLSEHRGGVTSTPASASSKTTAMSSNTAAVAVAGSAGAPGRVVVADAHPITTAGIATNAAGRSTRRR